MSKVTGVGSTPTVGGRFDIPSRERFELAVEQSHPGLSPDPRPFQEARHSPVHLPAIADAGQAGLVDRAGGADLVARAEALGRDAEAGAPASGLAERATQLFADLQGRLLLPGDAENVRDGLDRAQAALQASPAYAQGLVIPPDQSAAEGQVARCLDLLHLAGRGC